MLGALFVYGTLLPGQPRWRHLEPWCRPSVPRSASAPGTLFRTPYSWPAAVFDPASTSRVPGVIVQLTTATLEAALECLDVLEGVSDDLFDRTAVTLHDGTVSWAYAWPHSTDGFERIAAWFHPRTLQDHRRATSDPSAGMVE